MEGPCLFLFFFLITSFLYFGRAASSLLRGLSPVVTSCDAQASHYGGFSCAEHGLWAQGLRELQHVGSGGAVPRLRNPSARA